MLKTLKWVYDLGVKHERERVARLLETEMHNQFSQFETAQRMAYDSESEMKESRRKKLQLKEATHAAVGEIVANILQPDEEHVTIVGGSRLEPKEKK